MQQIINHYCSINELSGNQVLIDNNNDLKLLPDNIVYCHILCNNYNNIENMMDHLKSKLVNGSLVLFENWYYNIHIIDKNIRDIVKKWMTINNSELIDFNLKNTTLISKSFIYRTNPEEYHNWSD